MDFGLITMALLLGSVIAYQIDGGGTKQAAQAKPIPEPEQKLAAAVEEYLKIVAAAQAKNASQSGGESVS